MAETVTIHIPTPLRKYTDGQEAVEASGATVGEVLDAIEANHPGLKARVCDDAGKVRRFVNIFVNDEDIRHLDDLETQLEDGAELSIVPAIAGG